MKLNPSFLGIALSSLLAVDLWASKRLGVCAGEGSAWGSARPLMKVIEVSGHGIPWLLGTCYGLCQSGSSAVREVLLNLLFGEAGGSAGEGGLGQDSDGVPSNPTAWWHGYGSSVTAPTTHHGTPHQLNPSGSCAELTGS